MAMGMVVHFVADIGEMDLAEGQRTLPCVKVAKLPRHQILRLVGGLEGPIDTVLHAYGHITPIVLVHRPRFQAPPTIHMLDLPWLWNNLLTIGSRRTVHGVELLHRVVHTPHNLCLFVSNKTTVLKEQMKRYMFL